jgi:hypothetical protein
MVLMIGRLSEFTKIELSNKIILGWSIEGICPAILFYVVILRRHPGFLLCAAMFRRRKICFQGGTLWGLPNRIEGHREMKNEVFRGAQQGKIFIVLKCLIIDLIHPPRDR